MWGLDSVASWSSHLLAEILMLALVILPCSGGIGFSVCLIDIEVACSCGILLGNESVCELVEVAKHYAQ